MAAPLGAVERYFGRADLRGASDQLTHVLPTEVAATRHRAMSASRMHTRAGPRRDSRLQLPQLVARRARELSSERLIGGVGGE